MGIIKIFSCYRMGRDGPKKEMQPACRDYTLHLHKRLHGVQFKKRAPRAIRDIKRFATKEMYPKDVRIDNSLNRAVWLNGIRNIPRRIRIRVTRRRNEDEDAKKKFYSLVQHLEIDTWHGLRTEKGQA